MELASSQHSAQRREKARAREVEEQDQHEALRRQKAPPQGMRPGVLKDPEPQGRIGQHCGVGFELVQALDFPVLQKVLSFLRSSLPADAEQVVEVPTLSLPVFAVQRAVPLEPQMAEQLVEVSAPAPAVFQASSPAVEFIAPAPAVIQASSPVVEYLAPAPAVIHAPSPVVENIAPAPAVVHAPTPV